MTAELSEPKSAKRKRANRGPRKHPYYALPIAIDVAERVYLRGGGRVNRVQAAELLDVKASSSNLEMKLITAGQFGLIKRVDGHVEITDLGKRIVRPASQDERARALGEAFSSVQLFQDIRKRFEGAPLPDDEGLKNVLLRDFGIPEVQKNEAFNMMMTSAKAAGILTQKPSGIWFSSVGVTTTESVDTDNHPDLKEEPEDNSKLPIRNERGAPLHPSIEGLLHDLPRAATDWSRDDRSAWETALSAILDVAYPSSRRNPRGQAAEPMA